MGRGPRRGAARLRRALADTVAIVDGGTTNQGFLLQLLDHPAIRGGEVDTGWLDRLHVSGATLPVRHGDLALLVQAAIELADRDTADDRARFYAFARRGRPQAAGALSRTYELRHRGQSYRLPSRRSPRTATESQLDGQSVEVSARRLGAARAPPRAAWPQPPDGDLDPGRGLARRGRWRAASCLARRRRLRPSAGSRAGGRDPRLRRGHRRGGRRRRGRGGDEDGVVADRAVSVDASSGVRRGERPRRGAGAAGRESRR